MHLLVLYDAPAASNPLRSSVKDLRRAAVAVATAALLLALPAGIAQARTVTDSANRKVVVP
jgi:hypothetical protein